jgi:hypothetical protein
MKACSWKGLSPLPENPLHSSPLTYLGYGDPVIFGTTGHGKTLTLSGALSFDVTRRIFGKLPANFPIQVPQQVGVECVAGDCCCMRVGALLLAA